MDGAVDLVELWRGGRLESVHRGHVAVMSADGELLDSIGKADTLMYPRSSCKMVQALPLVESGAAAGLSQKQLAVACASHNGATIHKDVVEHWLSDMQLTESDLRCGPQPPRDPEQREGLIRAHEQPCQVHNNCSGKHAGFLELSRYLAKTSQPDPEYIDPNHAVQLAVRAAFEDVTQETSPGYGIDGCSAPNFATSLTGLARAMASFAGAEGQPGARPAAMRQLIAAMIAHPELIGGEGRCCTELMRACGGKAAIKVGAEAVYVAILPERRIGIALKIADGGLRAAEVTMATLLVRYGALAADHPTALQYTQRKEVNWRGVEAAEFRQSAALNR